MKNFEKEVAVSPSTAMNCSTARGKKVADFCTCENEDQDVHTCPYAEDIHDDDRLCGCCDYCAKQCAMDI